jgi:methylase of polypeptide subunit release factors
MPAFESTPLAAGAQPSQPQPDPEGLVHRIAKSIVHFFTYRFVLRRKQAAEAFACGFRFVVPPTVFHPSVFKTGPYFAEFIGNLNLDGLAVADIGTGSGILALAAARAGAKSVLALDINPHAAKAAHDNADINGLRDRITAICGNLMAPLDMRPMFDVIVSNPPYFAGEPRDLADRAWHSGPAHRDIIAMFEQARERLKPGGRMYVLFSTRADLDFLRTLMKAAGFRSRPVSERSILIDTFVIYELEAG